MKTSKNPKSSAKSSKGTSSKATYRGTKKTTINERRKAPQTVAQRKKKTSAIQPAAQIKRIGDVSADVFGVVLFIAGTFCFGSLIFTDRARLTGAIAGWMQMMFGKTAVFVSLMMIFSSIWILILRKVEKPFSWSWRVGGYLLSLYFFALLVIQRFAEMEAPFSDYASSGGVFAMRIDHAVTESIGQGGALILLFFAAVIFLLIAWKQALVIFPESWRKKLDVTAAMMAKVKSVFAIETETQDSVRAKRLRGMEEKYLPGEEPKSPLGRVMDKISRAASYVPGVKEAEMATDEEPPFEIDQDLMVLSGDGKSELSEEHVMPSRGAAAEKVEVRPLVKQLTVKELSVPKPTLQSSLFEKWRMPDANSILDPVKEKPAHSIEDDPIIQEQVEKIENVLEIFESPGKVVDIQCGPTFTQFGVEPGFVERNDRKIRVRVKQIETLRKDLEMALSVKQLAIEAPIPGKTFVGLQVQNRVRITVSLREVIESADFAKSRSGLGIALGKDINGDVFAADLTRMPHLLIAGATGSGKSVCLNAILVCLLMHYSPDQLKLVLIDPKRVELTGYNGIPHLVTPVVTEVEQVGNVLQWALREMDVRNQHFLEAGVRNIQDYNQKFPEHPLPYLVIVIDELASLMMEAAADVESSITRLAQTARAMGIHLIVATQRPSRDVITGTIKGNLPSRIAFAVATGIDSQVILDRVGAENLFGKGDMYLMTVENSNLRRLQCVYVSDEEIRRLVQYWRGNPRIDTSNTEVVAAKATSSQPHVTIGKRSPPPMYNGVLVQLPLLNEDAPSTKEDSLFKEAVALVRRQGRASANMLVTRMNIGTSRANKLLVQMEDAGIIGPPNPNPAIPREILDYGENAPPADA